MKKQMKKFVSLFLAALAVVTCLTLPAAAAAPTISCSAHCQNYGWLPYVQNGQTAGTTGQGLRMESIRIELLNASGGVTYRTHVQNYGWGNWCSNGQISGTTGQSLQVEAVEIKLTGAVANSYDIFYRTHVQNIGWQEWRSNGQTAGTTGQSLQVEAVEIKLVPKSGGSDDTSGYTAYVKTSNPNNRLNMRSAPSTSAGVVAKLSYGQQVKVLSESNGWARVQVNGQTGYVSTAYLSRSNPSPSGLTSPVPSGAKFSRKTQDGSWYGYHDINQGITSGKTPVYAITDGTVRFYQAYTWVNGKRVLTSYGNYAVFTSSDGKYTVKYCHLNSFQGVSTVIPSSDTLKRSGSNDRLDLGQISVSKGQVLGFIGNTGNSSGPHLHLEITRSGSRVDPVSLFPQLA